MGAEASSARTRRPVSARRRGASAMSVTKWKHALLESEARALEPPAEQAGRCCGWRSRHASQNLVRMVSLPDVVGDLDQGSLIPDAPVFRSAHGTWGCFPSRLLPDMANEPGG